MSINSLVLDQTNKTKKNTWKWWQANKESEDEDMPPKSPEEMSSLTPSSLMAQRSVHSRESDDMESTTSIKSKAWTFHPKEENNPPLSEDNVIPANYLEANIGHKYARTPPASITSSTIPVFNYSMDEPRRKSADGFFFPSLRAKLGKWVSSKDKPQ